jgi:hypothetical protein
MANHATGNQATGMDGILSFAERSRFSNRVPSLNIIASSYERLLFKSIFFLLAYKIAAALTPNPRGVKTAGAAARTRRAA